MEMHHLLLQMSKINNPSLYHYSIFLHYINAYCNYVILMFFWLHTA